MIPGQPVDPRVRDLKRAARVTLTAWVLLVIPLLAVELTLIILNGPTMIRTTVQSLEAQVRVVAADFGRADVPAGLVGVISAVMLVLPIVGLCYILLLTGRRARRAAVAANRRRPILWLPSVAVVLLVAAGLAAHWVSCRRPAAPRRVRPRPAMSPSSGRSRPRLRPGRWTVTWPAADGRGVAPPDGGRRPQCAASPAATRRTTATDGSQRMGMLPVGGDGARPARRPVSSRMSKGPRSAGRA